MYDRAASPAVLLHCHRVTSCANVNGMPWFAFDMVQGCGCKEPFQCWIDFAGFPYEMVPRSAFDQAKRPFRKPWCAKCNPNPPAGPGPARRARTSKRRAVRPADTGLDTGLDTDLNTDLNTDLDYDYDQDRRYEDGWPMP